MGDSQFDERVDATFAALEQALDGVDGELDYDTTGGVLNVDFANGTTMVFSRQPPTRQLWLAARAGGFHFEYDEAAGDWRDTRSGELFRPFVVGQIKAQAGLEFHWD